MTTGTIQTYTGKLFDPFNPDPKLICIEDIAKSLSQQNRFTGHTRVPYFTAQHSFYVSLEAATEAGRRGKDEREVQRIALLGHLHDGAEPYIGDMPRPLKRRPEFAFYREVERLDLAAVFVAFGLAGAELPPEVVEADDRMLATEARDIMVWPPPEPWDLKGEPYAWHISTPCWSSEAAEVLFLERFRDLMRRVRS